MTHTPTPPSADDVARLQVEYAAALNKAAAIVTKREALFREAGVFLSAYAEDRCQVTLDHALDVAKQAADLVDTGLQAAELRNEAGRAWERAREANRAGLIEAVNDVQAAIHSVSKRGSHDVNDIDDVQAALNDIVNDLGIGGR